MKLRSVTVRNYRVHKELAISFGDGLTVIAGPNESGKSTLVEAIHHALFLRGKATGEIAQSIRSALHAGHPSVILDFEADGKRWTIEKTFTGTSSGTTTLKEQGGRTRHNDEAEEEIHRLLQEDEVGGGRGIAERLRGRWAHLWVWQGTAGTAPVATGVGDRSMGRLRGRLGQLGGGSVLESAADGSVARLVQDLVAVSATDKGKVKAGSELARAVDELDAARAARTAADAALAALEEAVRNVDAAERALAEGTRSVAKIRGEIMAVEKRREDLGRVDAALAEARVAADAARRNHDELARADSEIRHLDERIRAAEVTLSPAREALECAKANEGAQRARLEAAVATLGGLTARRRDADAWARLHALVEQAERQRVERAGLASRCDLILAHRKKADEIRAQIRVLPAVKPDDVERLQALERTVDAAAAELRAIATRVELIASDAAVTLGQAALAPGEAQTITTGTEIAVGGSTRLRIIPGGGRSLAECTQRHDAAREAFVAGLAALGVATIEDARRAAARLTALANDLRAETTTVQGLGDEKALGELAGLDNAMATLEAQITRTRLEGFIRADGLEAALTARREADAEVARLASSLSSASTDFEVAQKLADGAAAEHARIAESIRTEQEKLADLRSRRQALLEKVGENREAELVAREAARRQAEDRLAATERTRAALEPESLDRDQKRVQLSLEQRQEAMQQAETRRQLALASFHASGTSDPAEDRARSVARETAAVANHARLDRDAAAARLLADLFREKKQAVEDRFIEPLKARVGDYLQRLFGPGSEVSLDLAGDAIRSVALSRAAEGAVPFGFGTLSGGTREQVGASLRLALAEILAADHDGCLPVVFDDAFVNADPERLLGLQRILDLGAERGLQVIVLTCDPAAYDTLGVGITEIRRQGS
jgi:DNA repair exonuclease SbcCD ATPase subunit